MWPLVHLFQFRTANSLLPVGAMVLAVTWSAMLSFGTAVATPPFDAEVYLDPGPGPIGDLSRYGPPRASVRRAAAPLVVVEDPGVGRPVDTESFDLLGPACGTAVECRANTTPPDVWALRVLPDGLIYRSYLAGTKEPRTSGIAFYSEHRGWLLDVTLGGRVGILRYGTEGGVAPQGWEVDIEGAGFPRLNLDQNWDLESADFRFGVPLTYGVGNFQTKLAYYHLSSHLGDELVIREPQLLASRINFSRDVMVLGVSYFPHPVWRLYGEAGWAFHSDGGSDPWEFQFGTELLPPGETTLAGAPFVAVNAHLRQELNYGGDLVVQAGWAWRGRSGQLFRLGGHYAIGKSTQFEFFDQNEQQLGFGIWYDY